MLYFMSTAAEQEYARWIKKKRKKKPLVLKRLSATVAEFQFCW